MEVIHSASYQRGGSRRAWPRISAKLLVAATFFFAGALGLAAMVFVGTGDGSAASASETRHLADALVKAKFDRRSGNDVQGIVASTGLGTDALEKLTPEAAKLANSRLADAADVGPAASPLLVPLADGKGYFRALDCMTAAVYYEAGNEPADGQRAVAQVILNRVRHFSYPKTVCGVVFQGANRRTGCQFSFTCDGSLLRKPAVASWQRARSVANAALAGLVYAPVGLATHYHADYVLPYWAPTLVRQRVIGHHIFYRWPGQWGRQASFANNYAQAEPDVWADMKRLAIETVPTTEGFDLGVAASEDVAMTARPVLPLAGASYPTGPHAGEVATTPAPQSRELMSSRPSDVGKSAIDASPPVRRSVTGGVIMPDARPLASLPGGSQSMAAK